MKCSICGGLIQDIYWEGEIPCSCQSRTESTQPMTTTEPKPQTPLTNAFANEMYRSGIDSHHDGQMAINHARSLELKLQEAKQEIMMLSIDGANKDELHKKQLQEAERQRDEALFQLKLIGDMAVVDWDDTTVGKVDGVLGVNEQPSKTYIERVRNLYKRAQDAVKLEAERDQLIKVVDELASGLKQHTKNLVTMCSQCDKALAAYSLLPHVIAKKGTAQ